MTELLPEFLNMEILTAVALLAIAIIRITAWGKANQDALTQVVDVVERVRADHVKTNVEDRERYEMSDAAADALDQAVRKVDVKKTAVKAGERALRLVVPRVVRKIPKWIGRIFK